MAELNKEQIAFLKSQGIAPTQVFDASKTKSKAMREAAMDAAGLLFYYGGAACRKAGHMLRSKAGHCIQCDTAKIAYQLRFSANGYVYLAYSKDAELIKVGFTKDDPSNRIEILCQQSYANANDWKVLRSVAFSCDAGRKEFEIHSLLERYQQPTIYEKSRGEFVECREVFSCDVSFAVSAFETVVSRV